MDTPVEVIWSLSLRLPWPPQGLSPNDRLHWIPKAARAKRYKAACRTVAAKQLGSRRPALPGPPSGLPCPPGFLRAAVTFRPPSRARRDLDNITAACKHGFDAVATVLGKDDQCFRPWVLDWGEPVAGGAVELTLEALRPATLPDLG